MKKKIDTNYMFSNEAGDVLSLTALAERMSRHITACGVTVSADECAHILAAMASHRLLYIGDDRDGGFELACAIASFVGCEGALAACTEDTHSFSELIGCKDSENRLCDRLSSFVGTGRICAAVIDNRVGIDLSPIFSGLDGYFSTECENCEVRLDGGTLTLPKNTYYIVVSPKGSEKALLGESMKYFCCPIICERLSTLVVSEADKTPVMLGAEEFYELTNDAYLKLQPSEEIWRSIDSIDAALSAMLGCGFGNDLYLTMEKYFSVFAACSDDAARAVDAIISEYIASLPKGLTAEQADALGKLFASMSEVQKLPKSIITVGSLSI